MLDKSSVKAIHCMGIGGVGVCGIAELLLAHGFSVSGSDVRSNANTNRLAELGATISIGHDPAHVLGADLVVYSSAIATDNPEYMAAQQRGIRLVQRAQVLAWLMDGARGIAVAGTHGKTTTTSLITHILLSAGLDPSFAIGGELKGVNQYAHLGRGDYFVAEADESDASFLHLSPKLAVVNNIEQDHMATYGDCIHKLQDTFCQFLQRLPDTGVAILSIDDARVQQLVSKLACRVVTVGFNPAADICAKGFRQEGLESFFTLVVRGKSVCSVCLNLPGQHNVQNALAAIAVAQMLGVDYSSILSALKSFPGVGRRFFIHGEITVKGGKALVIDDYGHHPSAVTATLTAARQAWPSRRLVLAFQPHRYTRTRDLLLDFAESLAAADVLLLLEVYSAGETAIKNADSQALCELVTQQGRVIPVYVPGPDALVDALEHTLQAGDVLLLQGAGSIGSFAKQLVV